MPVSKERELLCKERDLLWKERDLLGPGIERIP